MGGMPDPDNAIVLVADGEASVLEDVSSTLEKAGFTVLTAQGEVALMDFCAHHPEPVQLAIVDMAMAGRGPDVVEQLYQSYPNVRILFTANKDESKKVPQIGRSGHIRAFLKKPFRRSQLLGRVLQVLDSPMVTTA
jgi:CheY-like chemotaxis protein